MKIPHKHTICINGKFKQVSQKILDIFTPGDFVEDGVFETMLAVGHKVFDVQAHLKRLHGSLKGAKATASMIDKVVRANGFDMSRVRIVAWKEEGDVHTMIMALKYEPSPKKIYTACLVKTNRLPSTQYANTKSLDYRMFLTAYTKARAQGFDEVLLLNQKGLLFEASRANVFIIKNSELITPPLSSGCLNGITRQQVIKAAHKLGLKILEKDITIAMLKSAQEVFITNSLIRIKPVKISFTFLPR